MSASAMGCPCEGWILAPGWLEAELCWWLQCHRSRAVSPVSLRQGQEPQVAPADVRGGLAGFAGQPDLGMLRVTGGELGCGRHKNPL